MMAQIILIGLAAGARGGVDVRLDRLGRADRRSLLFYLAPLPI